MLLPCTSELTLVSGQAQTGVVLCSTGRPVDILVMPDGSMLVSDDYGGAITRIAYRG